MAINQRQLYQKKSNFLLNSIKLLVLIRKNSVLLFPDFRTMQFSIAPEGKKM